MLDDLCEAWQTNHRINLYLIDRISDEGMHSTLSKRGGRDVARQFAHMHNQRIWHLQKRAPDLAKSLVQFEGKVSPDKKALKEALIQSTQAVESFFKGVIAGEAKRRGFKKGICTNLAYFIAHESHHRGSILLTLKMSGHGLDKSTSYGIWAWDHM